MTNKKGDKTDTVTTKKGDKTETKGDVSETEGRQEGAQ